MKRLGDKLKSSREEKGLSLHEIGIQLKISSKILQAIEDGDQKKLPAKTFLRGFVRSYAQFLKLDVQECLQLFQEEMGSTHPEIPIPPNAGAGEPVTGSASSAAPSQKTSETEKRNSSASLRPSSAEKLADKSADNPLNEGDEHFSTNKAVISLAIIALVALILVISKIIDKYKLEQSPNQGSPVAAQVQSPAPADPSSNLGETQSPTLVTDSPASLSNDGKNEKSEVAPNTAQSQGSSPDAVAAVKIPEKPNEPTKTAAVTPSTPVPAAMKNNDPTDKKSEKNTEKITEKKIEKKPETTTNPKVEPVADSKPSAIANSNLEKPNGELTEVIVEATGKVAIQFDLGNGKKQSLELEKGQFHTFRSKKFIGLDVNDGGLLRLYVNGKSLGAAGKAGQPLQVRYPKP